MLLAVSRGVGCVESRQTSLHVPARLRLILGDAIDEGQDDWTKYFFIKPSAKAQWRALGALVWRGGESYENKYRTQPRGPK